MRDFLKGLERELPTIYAPKRYTKRLQEDGNPLPESSDYKSIKADEYDNGVVTLVPLDVGAYAEKYSQKAVRKNCTIPSWLDTFASKNQLSLSEVLQNALIGIYKQTNHLD